MPGFRKGYAARPPRKTTPDSRKLFPAKEAEFLPPQKLLVEYYCVDLERKPQVEARATFVGYSRARSCAATCGTPTEAGSTTKCTRRRLLSGGWPGSMTYTGQLAGA